jgi:hypothetical protein
MNKFKEISEKIASKIIRKIDPSYFDEEEPEKVLICPECQNRIFPGQKLKTYSGNKYHVKPCYRRIMKRSKKFQNDGILR